MLEITHLTAQTARTVVLVPGQLGAILLVVHLLNAGQVAGVMLCQLSLQRAVQRCGLLLLLLLLVAKVVVLRVEATAGEAAAVLLAIGAPPDFAVAALEGHVCVKEREREGGYYYWRMQISCVNHLINCLICSTALNSFNLMQLTPA